MLEWVVTFVLLEFLLEFCEDLSLPWVETVDGIVLSDGCSEFVFISFIDSITQLIHESFFKGVRKIWIIGGIGFPFRVDGFGVLGERIIRIRIIKVIGVWKERRKGKGRDILDTRQGNCVSSMCGGGCGKRKKTMKYWGKKGT